MIEIRSTQHMQGETHRTKILCNGTLEQLPDSWLLKYIEQSEGLQGCQSALHVRDRMVVLTRESKFPLELKLEQDIRHQCTYPTQAGSMQLGVFAQLVESNLSHKGGQIKLNYTLAFAAGMTNSNCMEIDITTQKGNTIC